MKLCRFRHPARASSQDPPAVGLVVDDSMVADLSEAGWPRLAPLLSHADPAGLLGSLAGAKLTRFPLAEVELLAPVDQQEIWAAGVTYFRSKKARMEESEFSATAYDRVYEAERPEL